MAEHRYTLMKSTLPSAKGVLMGRYIHNGTVYQDGFAAKMAADRPNMDVPSAKLLLESFGTCVKGMMQDNPVRIDLGDIVLEPAISGSVPELDSALGPDNKVYIAVRLGDALRNCLASVTPTRVSAEEADVRVLDVTDDGFGISNRHSITGTSPFGVYGVGLSLSGEGEGVKVVSDVDGSAVTAVYDSDEGTGQRVTMHLPTALPAGTAKVTVTTRGFRMDASEPTFDLEPRKVNVLAGDTPPTPADGPELERGYSTGHGEGEDDGKVFPGTGFVLEGTHIAGAAVKIGYYIAGQPQDTDVDSEDMTVTDTSITIDPASPALQEAIQATGTLTFTVTTAAGSDSYNAVVME